MKRLVSTIRWDIQLQIRQGFYYAAAVVALIMVILLSQLRNANMGLLLPAFLLENLVVNTFYFVAGLVLLEKGEGTLEGLIVTPLRIREYLSSKIATLALLSTVESLAIVVVLVFLFELSFNVLLLVVGIVLMATMYTLLGFIAIARYDSINEFLFPSALMTSVFSAPLLFYFDLTQSPLFYLHPLQAPLLLLQAGFEFVPAWQLVYGVLYSGLWIGLLYPLARRSFERFVIRKEGVRTT